METNTNTTPVDDTMPAEEAKATRLLIKEDIAKFKLSKAQALAQAAVMDARIAECELGLADIDRREAGVKYPEPPAKVAGETKGTGETKDAQEK